MSTNHPPTPLVDERYRDALQRFRQLERDLQRERETTSSANAAALEARQEGIRQRVRELEVLHDEIAALGDAIVAHPEIRNLPEARVTPPATVHDADPGAVFREIVTRQRERVADLGLELVPPPTSTPPDTEDRATASDSEQTDQGSSDVDAVVSCHHCGAERVPGSLTCPSCGRRVGMPPSEDTDAAKARGCGSGCGWTFLVLVFALWAAVAFLNGEPGVVRQSTWMCDVPLLGSALEECDDIQRERSRTPQIPAPRTGGSQPSTSGTATQRTHTVARGETLSQIATRYRTTVETLARINDIRDVNQLEIGDVIRLP
jgi:hypothetical protein